jgi:SAM-dependent methyltransferase
MRSDIIANLYTRIAKAALRLFPAYPGPDYRPLKQITLEMGLRQAELSYQEERTPGCGFLRFFGGSMKLSSGIVLDLGCGFGGRMIEFQRLGRGECIGLDIDEHAVRPGLYYARSKGCNNASFTVGLGEALPIAGDTVDMVLCYDGFEHVEDPQACLDETFRVLKPGGEFLTVFPPFFHPIGAHLNGYVSWLPYANLLFPRKVLLRAIDELLEERQNGYSPQPLRPGDHLYGMNGLTIRRFRRMLKGSRFEVMRFEVLPLFSRRSRQYKAWKMRYYAWVTYLLSRIPLIQECFTHRVVVVLRKPQY